MSFNTGNKLGSLDERDLYDNAINLDKAMNSTEPTWRDRFNVEKPTIDAALKSAGFMPAGFDFVTGGTLQPGDRNKAVYNPAPNGDNNWYRWNGTFPKEIAPNSQPNPKDENNWVPVEFNKTNTVTFKTVSDMKSAVIKEGITSCITLGYYLEGDKGAGFYTIKTGVPADGFGDHVLKDGRVAELNVEGVSNVFCFGAKSDGVFDNKSVFDAAKNKGKGFAFVPPTNGVFLLTLPTSGSYDGLYGVSSNTFKSDRGLVRYKNFSQHSGSYKTASDIKHNLSNGIPVTLGFMGDSTMRAYPVGGGNIDDVDPNSPPIIVKEVLYILFGVLCPVVNCAVSGSNLKGMLRGTDRTRPGITYEMLIAPGGTASACDIIYCNHGVNNCQENFSVEEYRKDFTEFVQLTRKYGKVPVIVTPNPIIPMGGGDARKSSQIKIYVQAARETARDLSCDLVDNYYFIEQSSKRFPITELIPDGVHPSSKVYRQNGYNLLIPLVSAWTLKDTNDLAQMPLSTFRNTTSGRTFTPKPETITGFTSIADRGEYMTGFTLPVIFDKPFKHVNFLGLKWPWGARILVGTWNDPVWWGVIRPGVEFGSTTELCWDSEFNIRTPALAGLQPIYWQFDMTDERPTQNTTSFSGLSVGLQGERTLIAGPVSGIQKLNDPRQVLSNTSIEFCSEFINSVTGPVFLTPKGNKLMNFTITPAEGIYVEFFKDNVVAKKQILFPDAKNGVYRIKIDVYLEKIVFSGRAQLTNYPLNPVLVELTESLPAFSMIYPYVPYTVTPF